MLGALTKKYDLRISRKKGTSLIYSFPFHKGVKLVAKSIFDQFRRGQPRRQPRGQPKRQKSWRFGVSESGGFSEILLKKMVFCRREASHCAVEDKENFSTRSNRGFAVSREEKNRKNLLFDWKKRNSGVEFCARKPGFSTRNVTE